MSSNNWKKEKRDQFLLRIPKGNLEKLRQLAYQQGKPNVSRLIKDSLYYYMDDLGIERINLE